MSEETGPVGYEWLRPLKKKGDERSDKIRELAHIPSEKRIIGQQVKMLKKLRETNVEDLLNPSKAKEIIAKLAVELLGEDMSIKNKVMLLDKLTKIYTTLHTNTNEEIKKENSVKSLLETWREQNKDAIRIEEERVRRLANEEK